MEGWKFALRRYDELTISSNERTLGRSERAECWLRDDVCSAVAEQVRRAEFRRLASWHRTKLAAGSKSEERALVDAIDAGLVDIARQQADILQSFGNAWRPRKRSRTRRPDGSPPGMKVVETVVIGSPATQVSQPEQPNDLRPDTLLRWSENIAERPWLDLVCPNDFIRSTAELNLREPKRPHVQNGMFVSLLNPNLRAIGDQIARSMKVRIEWFEETLRRIQSILREKNDARMCVTANEVLAETWRLYRRNRDALEVALTREPEASLREACVTLVQVYAAYRLEPELDWLDLSKEELADAPMLTRAFQGRSMIDALDRVPFSLRQLGKLAGSDTLAERQRSDLIASKQLVVDVLRNQAYWKGQCLDANWIRALRCFKLLSRLAEKARLGAAVCLRDIYKSEFAPSNSAFPMVRRRLGRMLPPDLDGRIVTVPGNASYRLDLQPHEVEVLNR
jgi:hypothetical protein